MDNVTVYAGFGALAESPGVQIRNELIEGETIVKNAGVRARLPHPWHY